MRRIMLAAVGVGLLVGMAGADETGPKNAPPLSRRNNKPKVQGAAQQRVQERLDRGLLALPLAGQRIYLCWRLLDSDPPHTAFNLYRQSGEQPPARINQAPLIATTDFVDAAPPEACSYFVRAVVDDIEAEPSSAVAVAPADTARPYVSIPLQGEYTAQSLAIADLDGDGRFDYVIKQPAGNVDPYERYWKRSEDTFKLEAYRHDGTFLWRYDLGWSIEQGVWYSPFVVYDLDGDGCAEVALKAGEGDPRDADGRVQSGPEYLLVLDGRTGRQIARTDWPDRDGFPRYDRYCRNQLGVAYLDGRTPCLIVERGTYDVMKIVAWELAGGQLVRLWDWNEKQEGPAFRGQGAHCLRAADVDGDGRDEVVIGTAVIDDNGVGLWSTGEAHPDHVTIGDLDPLRPGLEIHYGQEDAKKQGGINMVDAATGWPLWQLATPTTHIHGSGLCADLDPGHPGAECYGGERDDASARWIFSAQGRLIAQRDLGGLSPRAAYWDASLQRTLIRRDGTLVKFNGDSVEGRIEGRLLAVADVLGDWREEIISSVPGELRIYSTTLRAADRRVTFMRDPIYRSDVCGGSQGYYQIPSMTTLPSAAAGK